MGGRRAYKLRKYPNRLHMESILPVRRDSEQTALIRCLNAEEFVAHASNVNCLRIGRKSSGVMVTGGDDRKVNVWAIGKSGVILVCLPPHCDSLPVEAGALRSRGLNPPRCAYRVSKVTRAQLNASRSTRRRRFAPFPCLCFELEVLFLAHYYGDLREPAHRLGTRCPQKVVAGAAGGTLKLFDLEEAKGAPALLRQPVGPPSAHDRGTRPARCHDVLACGASIASACVGTVSWRS